MTISFDILDYAAVGIAVGLLTGTFGPLVSGAFGGTLGWFLNAWMHPPLQPLQGIPPKSAWDVKGKIEVELFNVEGKAEYALSGVFRILHLFVEIAVTSLFTLFGFEFGGLAGAVIGAIFGTYLGLLPFTSVP